MHVWVRSEPLIGCAINYPISHHINANTLRKTVNYAKNKGPSGYPKLEYSIWKYIACNKISIPEHVAWMHFETFFFISNYGSQKNMEFDIEASKCKTQEELDKLKESKKVDLYQFILHLYIQQFSCIDLKSSFMSREEWPVNRHDSNERRKSKTFEETNFMNFVIKNLDEILSLFQMDKSSNQNEIINDEIIQALNFLLEGSIDNLQTVLTFQSLMKHPLVQAKLIDSKVYVKSLSTFLRNYLEVNPFGIKNCLRLGKRITPNFLGGTIDPRKAGKIITNLGFSPKNDFIILISQISKQTLIESSDTFRDAGLYIDKCFYAYIYLLVPLRMCAIKRCRKSLLFVGPTQRSLTIDNCVECTIIAVCRRLIIRNCSACTFYLLSPSSPILLSGCDNIRFAPFNSTYPSIYEDAYASGLSGSLNRWDKPLVATQNQSSINGTHWSLMDPRDFYTVSVPVDSVSKGSGGTASGNELIKKVCEHFGTLPFEYEQELNRRHKVVEENLKAIQSANLTSEQQLMLQKCLENGFKDMMQLNGDHRQLDHLSVILSGGTAAAATANLPSSTTANSHTSTQLHS